MDAEHPRLPSCVGLRRSVVAGRTAAVTGPLSVPLDDSPRPPDRGSTDDSVRVRHLSSRAVRADGVDADTEEGRHVFNGPPVGLGVRRAHQLQRSGPVSTLEMYTSNVDGYTSHV
jgi:hypothetical protein